MDNKPTLIIIIPGGDGSPIGGVIMIFAFALLVQAYLQIWTISGRVLNTVLSFLNTYSNWVIPGIGIFFGLIIFIVSIAASANFIVAIIEGFLGICIYSFLYWIYLPKTSVIWFEPFLQKCADNTGPWFGLFVPLLLMLPMFLDSIFLSIGSINNSDLRDSYLKMHAIIFRINIFFLTAFLVLEELVSESAWNSFWMIIMTIILVVISSWVYNFFTHLILKSD